MPEESARKTLRDAVYELRRAFAPAEPVVATRESVELRAEVDLAAFAAHRGAGRLAEAARAAGFGRRGGARPGRAARLATQWRGRRGRERWVARAQPE